MRQDAGVDGDAQRISQLAWMFFLKIFDDQEQELEMMRGDYRSPMPAGLRWRDWAGDAEGITGEALLRFVNNELFEKLKGLSVADVKANLRAFVVREVFADAYNYMKSGRCCAKSSIRSTKSTSIRPVTAICSEIFTNKFCAICRARAMPANITRRAP